MGKKSVNTLTTTNLIIFLTRSSGMIGNKPFDFFFPRFFVCVQNKHSSIIKKITKQKNINISIEVKKGIGKSSAHALPFSKLYCFVVFFKQSTTFSNISLWRNWSSEKSNILPTRMFVSCTVCTRNIKLWEKFPTIQL